MKHEPRNVTEVRLTKATVLDLIAQEQREGGDATATKAVQRVLTEYRIMKRLMVPSRRRKPYRASPSDRAPELAGSSATSEKAR